LRIGCREEYLCLSGESKKGELRKLHNEELDDPYNPTNIFREIKSRRMSWAGRVAHRGERRGVGRVLVGKPEGKIPLGRLRHRWNDNIKRIFRKWDVCVCVCVCGVDLPQGMDRWRDLVNAVTNLRVP